jgi:hypothetical protein
MEGEDTHARDELMLWRKNDEALPLTETFAAKVHSIIGIGQNVEDGNLHMLTARKRQTRRACASGSTVALGRARILSGSNLDCQVPAALECHCHTVAHKPR